MFCKNLPPIPEDIEDTGIFLQNFPGVLNVLGKKREALSVSLFRLKKKGRVVIPRAIRHGVV